MSDKISSKHKVDRILQANQLLQINRTLSDVYTQIEQLSGDVLDIYPHIACRTKCNTCCKGTSMPVASAAEWAILHDYLMRFWTPEKRQNLIERVLAVYSEYKEALWLVHDNIQSEASMDKIDTFAEVLPRLEKTQCPFLIDEVCSVYPGRPAKCRAHGAFLFAFENHIQLHACQSEVDKMEEFVKKQGSRKVVMPFWNPFESKIIQDFNPKGAVSTILTMWVMVHLNDKNELLEEPDLFADFEALRDRSFSE